MKITQIAFATSIASTTVVAWGPLGHATVALLSQSKFNKTFLYIIWVTMTNHHIFASTRLLAAKINRTSPAPPQ